MPVFILFLACFFAISPFVEGQNLLKNGGFETHAQLDCIACPMFGYKFSAVLPPWHLLNGGYPFLCDCQLKNEAAAISQGICRFDKLSPHSGCNMMEMDYSPSCFDQNKLTQGVPTYLGTTLASPMEMGRLYEVSYWLHILPQAGQAADYARFIGMNLYPSVPRNPTGKMLDGTSFQVDTVVFGQWYQVKWLVRPLCQLEFLLLGVFRNENGPAAYQSERHLYYVDDVAVRDVTGLRDSTLEMVPHCRFSPKSTEDLPTAVAGAACYFDTNDSLLSPSAKRALDGFALRAKASPGSTFTLVGRTDIVGNNHKSLSEARIRSVQHYLEQVHEIPAFRFLPIPLGTDAPLGDNTSETGRQENRSVQIAFFECPLHLLLYRHVLLRVFSDDKTLAFKWLNIWLNVAPERRRILALFDPRLAPLRNEPRWKSVVIPKMRAAYQMEARPSLAFALDSLGLEDQKCRTLDKYVENLHVYLADLDSMDRRWEVAFGCGRAHICEKQDESHARAYTKLMGKDWPKISEVGERAAKTAFLIVSHSADTALIAQYLPLLKKRCEAGEAEWMHYATLSDRMAVHRGLPQRYGTQFRPPSSEGEKLHPFPLENPAKLNEWRKELGLEPIEWEK